MPNRLFGAARVTGSESLLERQDGVAAAQPSLPVDARTLLAAIAWWAAALLTVLWPDKGDWPFTAHLAWIAVILGAVLAVASLLPRRLSPLLGRIHHTAAWHILLAVVITIWQVVTAKLDLLPLPFFPPPQALIEVYLDEWGRLLECVLASLQLLATGYLIGALIGFVTGIGLGWSQAVGYWVHPVIRLIGPLPPVAWLPIAFFAFPSSWTASVFLIALATGVPVTILTWSGVAGVNNAYYDIARTLGGSERFLVLKVAVPAAMPHVYVGLFMGLAASFAVLVVAEMLGVKAGIGWYLQWALGWAAYANLYAALFIMALMCSGLVTLLFKVRDRHLAWQKGLLKW